MAVDRTPQRVSAAADKRRAPAPAVSRPRLDTGASAGGALQRRLGNLGTQSVIARSIANPSRDGDPHAHVSSSAPPGVQRSTAARLPAKVSKPTDRSELEAEETARKVMRMRDQPAPAAAGATKGAAVSGAPVKGTAQRALAAGGGAAAPASAPFARAPRLVGLGGGAALPRPVRTPMEGRFNANFGNVRVHTGEAAAQQSAALNANAFTVGQHIFFGKDRFQPQTASGQELIAHELTHTIQQGAVSRPVVQRSAAPEVSQQVAPQVQRSIFDIADPKKFFANQARLIPGFTMLTVAIGYNPITNERVERNAGNILRGAIELIPGGAIITDALNNHGVFDRVSAWAQTQFDTIKGIGATILQEIDNFISGFKLTDLASPGAIWDKAKGIVERPINRVKAFATALKDGIVTLIKDAILKPIAAFARTTSGYPLLCTVMGKDPITGETVPQDAESLLGAFMKFIGEEEIWKTMQEAQAVPRAFAWFTGAMAALKGFIAEIPGLFVQTFKSLEILDIVLIPRAFVKLAHVFGGFAGRFISWGATAVWKLLEIVFDVVSPGALTYIKKTGAAIKSIFRNPMPFVSNLIKAAKLGFLNFADNFLAHLKAGLIDWLTGSLPGIYIPKAFSLTEVAKFAFSVLGLTWANIRQKLVKATSETVVKTLETGFDLVVTLVRDGPAAAWDKIKEQLGNLKDMVIGGITDFVVDMVVKKAIPKLIALFIPGAGFISAIVTIYDTVMVFVNKIKQIIAVVTGFIDSIVAIAAGQIGAAAARVEKALAGVLALAINFLAGFASIGKVADKVMAVFNKLRAPIDKALDWLVGWIVKAAKGLIATGKAGVKALVGWWKSKVSFKAGDESHSLYFQGEGPSATLVVASQVQSVEAFLTEKAKTAKGPQVGAIASVRKLIDKVNALKPKSSAKAEDPQLQKKIQDLMNEIGGHLVTLLSSKEWGTEKNPSPFDYPKRQASAYPTFFLATGALRTLTQAQMRAGFAAQKSAAKGDRVYQFRPTQKPDDAPAELQKLGLGAASQVQVGKKVLFEDKEARGTGVANFKALVGRYGFVANLSGWDVDHVVELQIGGKDQWDNLWPLPAGENRSSGSIIRGAKVMLPAGQGEKAVKDALAEKKSGPKPEPGLWLIIKGTRQL